MGAFRLMIALFPLGGALLAQGVNGGDVFAEYCTPCHGADGKARTPAGKKLGAKDLSESKLPDAEIMKRILEGKKDERGSDRMPAFQGRLKESEVAALVIFVKTFRR